MFAWGNGRQGQLGNDQLEDKSRPTLVEGLRGASVVMVAAGNAHTLACTEHGLLFAFGCNRDGQLGIGDRTQRMMPVCVGGEERFGSSVVSAACGEAFSFSVTAQGLLFSWGRGLAGQLGHADTTDRLQPALVTSLAYHFGAKVVAAAGGESHSAAVAADGRVFTWGTGKHPLGPLPRCHPLRHVSCFFLSPFSPPPPPLPSSSQFPTCPALPAGVSFVLCCPFPCLPDVAPLLNLQGPRS